MIAWVAASPSVGTLSKPIMLSYQEYLTSLIWFEMGSIWFTNNYAFSHTGYRRSDLQSRERGQISKAGKKMEGRN